MTSNMAKESSRGRMEPAMRVITRKEKKRARGDSRLQTAATTRATFIRTRYQDTENTSGQTARRMLATGQRIRWTGSESSSGVTARNTKATGIMGNSTDRVALPTLQARVESACGATGTDSSGFLAASQK